MNCKIINIIAKVSDKKSKSLNFQNDIIDHFAEIELPNGENTTAEITEKTYFELLDKMEK